MFVNERSDEKQEQGRVNRQKGGGEMDEFVLAISSE